MTSAGFISPSITKTSPLEYAGGLAPVRFSAMSGIIAYAATSTVPPVGSSSTVSLDDTAVAPGSGVASAAIALPIWM
jgi:hypothetical protein